MEPILCPKDVDEYIHMTGGHVFSGGVVPKDYLRTAWDSIVSYYKAEKKKIQTIKFYRWGMDNKLHGYFRSFYIMFFYGDVSTQPV